MGSCHLTGTHGPQKSPLTTCLGRTKNNERVQHEINSQADPKVITALSRLDSQNPGVQLAYVTTFASKPPIPEPILQKAFQISSKEVDIMHEYLYSDAADRVDPIGTTYFISHKLML
ncbi:hypothetical protein Lal_00026504 [Lupinus albus]|nr:hypothetical protein Lal_00026504 [Lupinus albus]